MSLEPGVDSGHPQVGSDRGVAGGGELRPRLRLE